MLYWILNYVNKNHWFKSAFPNLFQSIASLADRVVPIAPIRLYTKKKQIFKTDIPNSW